MKAPSTVYIQNGVKTNKYGEGKSRSTVGKNQGKVAGNPFRGYQSHPRKAGQ